ncbi:MAG TPA: CTP synthase [Patescibacteria group bacterium]|nr:CTP synthase [Patescibacteria group bacterium]
MSKKYIFVVGGVMSSVGKGVAAASIGTILKSKGFHVTALKADPYVNIDAGTMNPTEHGEVFVTKDGDECDQDMGNYERFLNEDLTKLNYMTTGRVYKTVIERERNLEYGGRCVEVVPHIPEEIIRRINLAVKETKAEIAIIEIGGTVGEYQNLIFLEAARMMHRKNPRDVAFVLVSYLPIPSKVGEMKTKLTQTATRELNSCGIQPDFILCRAEHAIDDKRREKLATFCSIEPENAISAPDVDCIYNIPVNFEKEQLGDKILKRLHLKPRQKDLVEWRKFISTVYSAKNEIKIGIVGKYFETGSYVLSDSYISIIESVRIAAWTQGFCPKMVWLSSDEYETNPAKLKELRELDGVIVPGGFGSRGVEGKIAVAQYCRENQIPYLGLCYGMQIATIEFARNVCKLQGAHTEEIDPQTPHPVIHIMPEQKRLLRHKDYGGSMRLGEYACKLQKGTISDKAYHKYDFPVSAGNIIMERHRHRYEINNDYRERLEKCGLVVAGVNPDRDLVEIIEIKDHPFMVGTQFHPEFDSRPLRPQPLFMAFVKVAGDRNTK